MNGDVEKKNHEVINVISHNWPWLPITYYHGKLKGKAVLKNKLPGICMMVIRQFEIILFINYIT